MRRILGAVFIAGYLFSSAAFSAVPAPVDVSKLVTIEDWQKEFKAAKFTEMGLMPVNSTSVALVEQWPTANDYYVVIFFANGKRTSDDPQFYTMAQLKSQMSGQ